MLGDNLNTRYLFTINVYCIKTVSKLFFASTVRTKFLKGIILLNLFPNCQEYQSFKIIRSYYQLPSSYADNFQYFSKEQRKHEIW